MAGGSLSDASLMKPTYEEGKESAQEKISAVLSSIDVGRVMRRKIRREGNALHLGDDSYFLAKPPRMVAFGKAANRIAAVMYEILEGWVDSGVVVSPAEPGKKIDTFTSWRATPTRPRAALQGAQAALSVRGLGKEDWVIYLVLGGARRCCKGP